MEEFEFSAQVDLYLSLLKATKATFQHYVDIKSRLFLINFTVFDGLYHCSS